MNEKLQYATMLEIPVNTCNVTFKHAKRRGRFKKRAKTPEAVKEELLLKVNANVNAEQPAISDSQIADENSAAEYAEEIPNAAGTDENGVSEEYVSASVREKKRRPIFRFTAVTAEVIAIIALVATIFLTNAFYPDSAINVFMRKVFAPETTATEKTYEDFAPVVRCAGAASVEDGVISYSASGAVYAPCDGTVYSVEQDENGGFVMTVSHGGKFYSAISGLKYAYLTSGDSVYGNIPVGYAESGVAMCFKNGETVITDYTLENNAVLWAV